MGFHICITNPEASEISILEGVYGNSFGNVFSDANGQPKPSSGKTLKYSDSEGVIWGKIKDLYGVKEGDLIILYIRKAKEFMGVFRVTENPYILFDDLFQDPYQKYPFRFNFVQEFFFPNNIPSHEFYSLVEQGKINSTATVERDVNASYRGIRQLFEKEYQEILKLFYKYNPKTDPNNFTPITHVKQRFNSIEALNLPVTNFNSLTSPTKVLFNKIPNHQSNNGITSLEDILHAYIVYNVLHDKNNVIQKLNLTNFNELILEAPIFKLMQYRSDILATFGSKDRIDFYSFFELKRDKKIGIRDLSQLMNYLKSFASSKSLPINSFEGVYISNDFDEQVVEYLENRRLVESENIVSLIKYQVLPDNKVELSKII
ncbi:EVE domain-containing protein [Robertkochia flava]|uniref:hypothetical protein n=1 Tax=Robertkochia flava TaxID=3447986 RepID=UPI001CCC0A6F|nr:hypothetical protein [Robertkochia marina]